MPALLVIVGLMGLLFIGSLAALVATEDRLVSGFFAITAIFTVSRMIVALVRA